MPLDKAAMNQHYKYRQMGRREERQKISRELTDLLMSNKAIPHKELLPLLGYAQRLLERSL